MSNDKTYTLFEERIAVPEGENSTQIALIFKADGSLKVDGVYAGPSAKAFWGDWDHEFWMDIPASHAQPFLSLIARDAFSRDGRLTYADLRELCAGAEIPITEGHWT